MRFAIGEELKIGSVVIVPWTTKTLNIGIYAGKGNGTQQWYHPLNVINWNTRECKTKRPYVHYIKHCDNYSMVPISLELVNDISKLSELEQALLILKERKLI